MPDAADRSGHAPSPQEAPFWHPLTPDLAQPVRHRTASLPEGALAIALAHWAGAAPSRSFLAIVRSEAKAERLARAVRGCAPAVEVFHFPGWDCLPYDRARPSLGVMGQRMAVLARLAQEGDGQPRIVISTADAVLQRVVPRSAHRDAVMVVRRGDRIDLDSFRATLEDFGYILDQRVDEPGEAALRGAVLDVFPGGHANPCRVDLADDRITALRRYDPATQRSLDEIDSLVLRPASEAFRLPDTAGTQPARDDDSASDLGPGAEHWLPDIHPNLETLFDYLPGAAIFTGSDIAEQTEFRFELVADAYASRLTLRGTERLTGRPGRHPLAPERLYLTPPEWEGALATHAVIEADGSGQDIVRDGPSFVGASEPAAALARHVGERSRAADRIVLTAPGTRSLRRLVGIVQGRTGQPVERLAAWDDVGKLCPGAIGAIRMDVARGFLAPGLAVVSARDAARRTIGRSTIISDLGSFRIGDHVVHAEHGIGILTGIETVETDGVARDYLEITYAGDARLMVPAEEIGLVWRYGSPEADVGLDRLDGDAWERRKAEVEAELKEVAAELRKRAEARARVRVDPVRPPERAFGRLSARFAYVETPDQAAAIQAVLDDLASGRPMDRLVCGDVGFGKTEVALRAAAAVALAGRQVAIVAPTTILARQHFETFRKRFAGAGIAVAQLSRSVPEPRAKETRAGLADGSIRVAVGTHALMSKRVRFKDLGLLVIDEEQRFGVRQKQHLRGSGRDLHVLTLTATPIPRTLQSALAGIQDLSVIATPPARRYPVRTFSIPFDPVVVREALIREQRRDGQSFFVCPRIEDLEPMERRLRELVPELRIVTAHGRMPSERLDEIMVRFADGEDDVLLSTNIIETGLDIPGANTILVWRADRFGLSQLHQLRGRVGRGRTRAVAYLLVDPGSKLSPTTEGRLRTLEAMEHRGAGFEISARDLDRRGAGNLLGPEQAGHLRLVGSELYQHLLRNALAEPEADRLEEWNPDVRLAVEARIPPEYIPDPELRIRIHHRLSRLRDPDDVLDFAEEVEDRFGPPPRPVQNLFEVAVLRQRCRRHGLSRAEAGPKGAVVIVRQPPVPAFVRSWLNRTDGSIDVNGERLLRPVQNGESPTEALGALLDHLDRAMGERQD